MVCHYLVYLLCYFPFTVALLHQSYRVLLFKTGRSVTGILLQLDIVTEVTYQPYSDPCHRCHYPCATPQAICACLAQRGLPRDQGQDDTYYYDLQAMMTTNLIATNSK